MRSGIRFAPGVRTVSTVALALLLAACSAPAAPAPATSNKAGSTPAAAPADAINLRLAVNNGPNTTKGKQELEITNRIKEKSGGKLNVEIFWEGALGGERAAMEAALNKSAEMGLSSSSNFSALVKDWTAIDLPFLVTGYDGLASFLNSDALKELESAAESKGFKIVGYIPEGFRHIFTTKKEIKTPADLKGVKLRTTFSPIEAAYITAFGGNPTPVDWAETYLALKQGTVEGYTVAYSSVVQFKMNDAVKYVAEVGVVPIISIVAMNLEVYNGLSPDLQKAIIEAGKEATAVNLKLDQESDGEFKSILTKEGVKVFTPTAEDLKPWRELSPQVYDKFKDQVRPDWLAKARASQKQ